jgi:sortase A
MKARVLSQDEETARPRAKVLLAKRRGLGALEWFFLLFGLIAVDCYVWINTSALLYQAYQDWAFDETLRGLSPSIPGFIADEARWLVESNHAKVEAPPENLPNLEQLPAEKTPAHSAIIGRLEIPRLRLRVMVREGADERTLHRAVGHIPGTALPGRKGNIALAGHRDTFFRELRNIKENDAIDLQTENGTYRYTVESTEIVGPRDVGVLAAAGSPTLTLVTCYPFYYVGSAPKRFVVRATQVGANPSPPPQRGS